MKILNILLAERILLEGTHGIQKFCLAEIFRFEQSRNISSRIQTWLETAACREIGILN